MGKITRDQLSMHIAQVIKTEVKYFFDEGWDARFCQLQSFLNRLMLFFQSELVDNPDDDLFRFPNQFMKNPAECSGFAEEILDVQEHHFGALFMCYILLLEIYQGLSTVPDQASEKFAALKNEIKVQMGNVLGTFKELFKDPSLSEINPAWFYLIEEYTCRGLKHGEDFKKVLLLEFQGRMQYYFELLLGEHSNRTPIFLGVSLPVFDFIEKNLHFLYPNLPENARNDLIPAILARLFDSIPLPVPQKDYVFHRQRFEEHLSILSSQKKHLSPSLLRKIHQIEQAFQDTYKKMLRYSFSFLFVNEVNNGLDRFATLAVKSAFPSVILVAYFLMPDEKSEVEILDRLPLALIDSLRIILLTICVLNFFMTFSRLVVLLLSMQNLGDYFLANSGHWLFGDSTGFPLPDSGPSPLPDWVQNAAHAPTLFRPAAEKETADQSIINILRQAR